MAPYLKLISLAAALTTVVRNALALKSKSGPELEHVLAIKLRSGGVHLFRTPYSVSAQSVAKDIETFEQTVGEDVVGIGAELGASEATQALVTELRRLLL